MTHWIEVDGVRRWEVASALSLPNLKLARACKEVGISPERLGEVLGDDHEQGSADWLSALAIVLYASRVAAGETPASVEAANDMPYAAWRFVSDETDAESEPVAADPTEADSAEVESADL